MFKFGYEDDRNFVILEEMEFKSKCHKIGSEQNWLCSEVIPEKHLLDRCLGAMFLGHMGACEFKRRKALGPTYDFLLDGTLLMYFPQELEVEISCEEKSYYGTKSIQGLVKPTLPAICSMNSGSFDIPKTAGRNVGIGTLESVGRLRTQMSGSSELEMELELNRNVSSKSGPRHPHLNDITRKQRVRIRDSMKNVDSTSTNDIVLYVMVGLTMITVFGVLIVMAICYLKAPLPAIV